MLRNRLGAKRPAALAALGLGLGLALGAPAALPAAPSREAGQELVVYTYDSFVSEWGTGPRVVPQFEQKSGVKVRLVSVGDAGQVLNRAILEKDRPQADLLIGIDNNLLAGPGGKGAPALPLPGPGKVPAERLFDPTQAAHSLRLRLLRLHPRQPGAARPARQPGGADRSALARQDHPQDPRTSSPGLGFLLWTIAVYGERLAGLLAAPAAQRADHRRGVGRRLRAVHQPGRRRWCSRYTTSPAYHWRARRPPLPGALFPEGHYLQIEGLGILKGAPHPEMARRFIDFALSEDFQREIPLTNWMYPVYPASGCRTPIAWRRRPAETPRAGRRADRARTAAVASQWARLAAPRRRAIAR